MRRTFGMSSGMKRIFKVILLPYTVQAEQSSSPIHTTLGVTIPQPITTAELILPQRIILSDIGVIIMMLISVFTGLVVDTTIPIPVDGSMVIAHCTIAFSDTICMPTAITIR